LTTTEANKNSSPGFFTIYKPGQGKFVRWGTVAAIVLLVGLAMYWAFTFGVTITGGVDQIGWVTWTVVGGLGVLGAFLAFVSANRPRSAEFMIMTESEMRKVTWPTRATVFTSTKVVIVLTLILAVILASIDAAFMYLFRWLEIL
jgi:preprotein translocase SecE subunit